MGYKYTFNQEDINIATFSGIVAGIIATVLVEAVTAALYLYVKGYIH